MEKPKCALIGQDGNIFNLVGIASRTLKQNGMREQAKEMSDKVFSSHSYDEALNIIGEYVEITDEAGLVEEEEFEQEEVNLGKQKVTISDINESLYDANLDTEYREALANAMIELGYVSDYIWEQKSREKNQKEWSQNH